MSTSHSTILAYSLALATLSLCSPLPAYDTRVSVRTLIPTRAAPGVVEFANIHRKYKVEVPRDVVTALSNTDVIATPGPYDSGYLAPVVIGGQSLNLSFDTGSADLWVFSTELSSSQSAGHTLYNPNLSNTSRELFGFTWEAEYIDGNFAEGNVYTDSVTIDNITVVGQAVQLAERVSSAFQEDTGLSGLIGLAFGSINTVQPVRQLTFFESAIQENLVSEKVFTADLKAGEPGTYEFGSINTTKYTGNITYTPVDNSNGFWNITTVGMGINGTAISIKNSSAIVDTGSSLLILDAESVATYWSNINGAVYNISQGGYTFPCDETLLDLNIAIDGYVATVPGAYLNYAPISSTTCYGGLQSDAGLSFSILGDVFIKSQFVVFDYGNMRLGLATKPLNTTASTPTPTPTPTTTAAAITTATSTTSGLTPSLMADATPTTVIVTVTIGGVTITETQTVPPASTTFDDGMWHTTYYHPVMPQETSWSYPGTQNLTSFFYTNTTASATATATPVNALFVPPIIPSGFVPSGIFPSGFAPSGTAYPMYPGYINGTFNGTFSGANGDRRVRRGRMGA